MIAPDMRGYGGSLIPADPAAYSQVDIAADLVGLLDALNIASATVVGYDWGAVAAWNAALQHPQRFEKVVGLTFAYIPRGDVDLLHQLKGNHRHFYMDQHRSPLANAFLMLNVAGSLRLGYWTASGEAPKKDRFDPFANPLSSLLPKHTELPSFIDRAEFDEAVRVFRATGFKGGLNWYRGIEATFERTAAFRDVPVTQPSLFMVGAEDAIVNVTRPRIEALPRNAPGLTKSVMRSGVSYWLQQEAPDEVNAALLDFLAS